MEQKKIHVAYSERIDWITKLSSTIDMSTKQKTKFEVGLIQQNILTKHLSKFLYAYTRVNIDDLESFLQQIQASVVLDPHTFIISMMYFEKVVKLDPKSLSNYKNLFCICIVLSLKMNEERIFKNKMILERLPFENMDLKRMNQMEIDILIILEYKLVVQLKDVLEFLFKPLNM